MDISTANILIASLLSSLSIYVGASSIGNFKVVRENKNKKVKVFPSRILDKCNTIRSEAFNNELRDELINFYFTLSNKLDPKNLYCLNRNLEDLRVRYRNSNLFGGSYDTSFNSITLGKLSDMHALYHELLHLASTHRENGVLFSGFSQYNQGELIAEGINEGYTELLTHRYFDTKNDSINIYKYLTQITGILEFIVGKDKMENYYFNSHLDLMYNDLCQYTNKDVVDKLIIDTDYLLSAFKKLQSGLTYSLNLNTFKEVNYILTNIYRSKLVKENNYSEEAMEEFNGMLPHHFNSSLGIYFFKENNYQSNKTL